jgi:hyperosmotically inducible protein
MMSLKNAGAAALLALLIGAAGCHSHDRTTGQAINDKMTAFNINRALGSDPIMKYPDVKVNVYNGTAQLTGFVDSDQQRAKAAEIASGVPGVTQVINEITTKPPTPTGRAAIRDVGRDVNPNQPVPPPPR